MWPAERQKRVQFPQERLHLGPRQCGPDDDRAKGVPHEADPRWITRVLYVAYNLLDESESDI